ncbi:alpha/beta hydrolase family protein [Spirosoma gilvum]
MEFKNIEEIEVGVVQHDFDICVAGETVPSVLWTPERSTDSSALIAMGHGGSQHKKSANIRTRAIRYAKDFGWATLAIDAPKHGNRIGPEEAEFARASTLARLQGKPIVPSMSIEEKIKYLDDLTTQAVPEWQAALDLVLESNLIGMHAPVAYCGVSQGSSIGIPLLATDKRFCCAILGLAHLHPNHISLGLAAQKITIPLRFVFQWDDSIRDRNYGLALFDAFGSREKSMHINSGGHTGIPKSEVDSWDQFLLTHLH